MMSLKQETQSIQRDEGVYSLNILYFCQYFVLIVFNKTFQIHNFKFWITRCVSVFSFTPLLKFETDFSIFLFKIFKFPRLLLALSNGLCTVTLTNITIIIWLLPIIYWYTKLTKLLSNLKGFSGPSCFFNIERLHTMSIIKS